MKETRIRLSILAGLFMLLLMPNVVNAQNNLAEESISSQSSAADFYSCPPQGCPGGF